MLSDNSKCLPLPSFLQTITWADTVGKQKDTGRWRQEPDFPKDAAFLDTLVQIRVLYADFTVNTTGVNVVHRQSAEEDKILDLKK